MAKRTHWWLVGGLGFAGLLCFVCCSGVWLMLFFPSGGGLDGDFSMELPTDIEATNRVRGERDLRPIAADWEYLGRNFRKEIWADAAGKNCKEVQRDVDGQAILWEQDQYYSGSSYLDVDGSMIEECLAIYYDYELSQFAIAYVGQDAAIRALERQLQFDGPPVHPRTPGGQGGSGGSRGAYNEETLRIADQILSQWNVPRK